MTDNWKTLLTEMESSNKRLLILGETHGAKINPEILDVFVNKLGIQTVMLELETKWQSTFELLKNKPAEFVREISKEEWLVQSGLIGREHLPILGKFLENGKKIVPIKIDDRDWDTADRKTADFIRKYIQENPREKILLVIGNLHARTKPFILTDNNQGTKNTPLGYHLANIAISTLIRYPKGEIYNFDQIKIEDEKWLDLKTGSLIRSTDQCFAWEYMARKTEPLTLLTECH